METPVVRVGYQGALDSSLLALRVGHPTAPAPKTPPSRIVECVSCEQVLCALESDAVDLAVVTLDEAISRTCKSGTTPLRILGRLLGGDLRAFVDFSHTKDETGSEPRSLAAVNPEVAVSRWEEICWALDLDASKIEPSYVPPSQLYSEIASGRFNLAELNTHWEGLLALRQGIVSHFINPTHFGLPGSFSHIIVAKEEFITSNREWLRELRQEIASFYQDVLSAQSNQGGNDFSFSISGSEHFSQGTGFLSASLRVLAPHYEEFLRCNGSLRWEDVVPYFCWFEKNVAQRRIQSGVPTTAIHLEQLLCECWS